MISSKGVIIIYVTLGLGEFEEGTSHFSSFSSLCEFLTKLYVGHRLWVYAGPLKYYYTMTPPCHSLAEWREPSLLVLFDPV